MKSSLTGDEPADVLGYRKTHGAFPHDTTANQWFTESQFESYRRLGLHVVRSTFEPAQTQTQDYSTGDQREQLFKALLDIWFPPTPEMEKFRTVHADRYAELIRRVREDSQLTGLLDTLYIPGAGNWKATASQADITYAVAFTSELLEFMETVYLDLNLVYPPNARHPHSHGWINVFKKCAAVDVIRDGWMKFGSSYSPTFQRFASDVVNLPPLS
jgi:hypothetical protein